MVAQGMLRTYEVKVVLSETNFGFDDSFEVFKCLQQIEIPDYSICVHRVLSYHLI